MKYALAICALLLTLPRPSMSDESFRCGRWVVSADTSVAELLKKCGKPTSRRVSTEDDLDYGAKVGTWTTEIWRYDRGSRAAPMIVTIVNGQIRSIERGK
jgi:hypothetical protein